LIPNSPHGRNQGPAEELLAKEANVKRFEREARLASSLDHANICTIFDLNEIDGIHFIAMQYIAGQCRQCQTEPLPLIVFTIAQLPMPRCRRWDDPLGRREAATSGNIGRGKDAGDFLCLAHIAGRRCLHRNEMNAVNLI